MLKGLVIARRIGETVWIGSDVAVTVVRVGNGQCRLHIHAPQALNIVRDEIKNRRGEFLEADEVADVKLECEFIDHG